MKCCDKSSLSRYISRINKHADVSGGHFWCKMHLNLALTSYFLIIADMMGNAYSTTESLVVDTPSLNCKMRE